MSSWSTTRQPTRSVARAKRTPATVIVNDVNAGFAAGANQGAALGTGEFILFLNPDAAIDPADLERLVAELAARPDLGVVAPRIRYDDGTEQRVRWPYPVGGAGMAEALGLHRILPAATERRLRHRRLLPRPP